MFLVECPGTPRVLIISPHPDDEVIGAGSRLPLLPNTVVLQITNGAPAAVSDAQAAGFSSGPEYARARHAELRAALRVCGLAETLELNIPDQKAAFHLVPLTRRIQKLIARLTPDYIITVPYEGGHPDHDATAFSVHYACANLPQPPPIIEMLSYHNEKSACVMDRFLNEGSGTLTVNLTEKERELKRSLFGCFPSQANVLRWFPIQVEKFRVAPACDFTSPPHSGLLYYEMFPWGMTQDHWCELARAATVQLRNPRSSCHELAYS
ncbi:MAG TPA: PIG-L family deacetylase [Verrucomicrobiae bacterium]|nr:PIG-L family deacetylase [Verrucomicrobiae bacterium]